MKLIYPAIILLLFALPLCADLKSVTQLIEARCIDCHDEDVQKGGVNLQDLLKQKDLSIKKTAALWQKIEAVVRRGDMP